VLSQNKPNLVKAGAYTPVRLPGDQDFRTNIKECNGIPVVIGDTLPTIDASTTDIGDSVHKGFKHLIDLDPHAEWDPTTNSVINSCAQGANPCAGTSPRVVALPVYNTGQYFNGIVNGQAVPPVNVVNIVGFFVDWEDGRTVNTSSKATSRKRRASSWAIRPSRLSRRSCRRFNW
jgi:hypothetical protein